MVSKAPRSSGILTYDSQGCLVKWGEPCYPKCSNESTSRSGTRHGVWLNCWGFTALSFWALLASGSKYIIQGLCKPMPSLLGGLARWAG